MRATWLADTLRDAGLTVIEVDGWQRRGKEMRAIQGVVCHHTASPPNAADTRVAALLRDGRHDLPGPLSQLGLDRAGRYWLIAAGRSNHNGKGEWGNDSIGIEAFNDGKGEPWPDTQMDAYAKGCAAIAAHLGLPVANVRGHKEVDPKRKIDPTFDMDAFRERIARTLNQEEDVDYDKLREIVADEVNKAVKASHDAAANRDQHWVRLFPLVEKIAKKVGA